MGIKGSKQGGQQTKVQESPIEKMLKYWDDGPHTEGEKKQRLIKYCYFIWTQESILQPLSFWPKI
jgi:hypothetical protein